MWNCHGYRNFLKLDQIEQKEFTGSDLICLYETWQWKSTSLPSFLQETHILCHESCAIKEKQLGRSSGGIILYARKNLECQKIEITEYWIRVKIMLRTGNITCGIFYFKPSLNDETVIEMIEDVLKSQDFNEKIILAGDFNARIGTLNFVDQDALLGTKLIECRKSKDKSINKRGQKLTEVMENFGMIALNGRVEGDIPGEYTFVERIGVSTVDLVWVNIQVAPDIKELRVTENSLHSDHLPLRLLLKGYELERHQENLDEKEYLIEKYIWDDAKKTEFSNKLEHIINNNDIYTSLKTSIHKASENLELLVKSKLGRKYKTSLNNKKWYNKTCRTLKFKMRQQYRKWKRKNVSIHNYLDAKKLYLETLKAEEKRYIQDVQKTLANVKNTADFWKEIKKFRTKQPYEENNISIIAWEQYLFTIFDQTATSVRQNYLLDARHDYFDAKITSDEMYLAIHKMKCNKTPGPDKIIVEQIKHLNIFWGENLLDMYNKILEYHKIPSKLANIDMVMLHKKGDQKNPGNYRSIALLNNLFKIFTQILVSRIYNWCEENNIINEGQMGFRKQRGCLDGIFVLSAIVGLRIRSLNKKVYAAFVDFKRAFSSVPHEKLWLKLFKLGLSGNIIRTIQALYDHARARIKVKNKYTREARITTGLLEGDPLSALAFILYISDLEEFLRNKGFRGVSINAKTDILLLMYADDLVLVADSGVQMRQILDALEEYCDGNGLTVNVQKTSVVVFKNGRISAHDKFSYKGETVETQSTFSYLGVMFSSSGLWLQAACQAKRKANIANSSIINTLVKSKSQCWTTKKHLYDTIAKSTLLYASEVWALRYLEELNASQLNYFKIILQVSRSTPGYMVRRELGLVKISYWVIKQTLAWWLKLLNMQDHRYPKICYLSLKLKHEVHSDKKYNWVSQLYEILRVANKCHLWETQDPDELKEETENILLFYKEKYLSDDEDRIQNSSYSNIYKNLTTTHEMQKYLDFDCPIHVKRTLSQLRTSGKQVYINIKGTIYAWSTEELCTICNLKVPETLQHILLQCPMYTDARRTFLQNHIERNNTLGSLEHLLAKDITTKKLFNIHNFIKESMKIRSFILNE